MKLHFSTRVYAPGKSIQVNDTLETVFPPIEMATNGVKRLHRHQQEDDTDDAGLSI